MSRTFPIIAVACLGGAFASLLAGFLLASWAVAGITPAYAAPPPLARSDTAAVSDGWRDQGYDRIGLWEQPHADMPQPAGSSRL